MNVKLSVWFRNKAIHDLRWTEHITLKVKDESELLDKIREQAYIYNNRLMKAPDENVYFISELLEIRVEHINLKELGDE